MHVVVIRETTDELNIVGPFWDEQAARDFVACKLSTETSWVIVQTTDRDKF